MGTFDGGREAAASGLRVELRGDILSLPLVDGIHVKPVMGERLNIQEVTLSPGATAPIHTHDEEQLGYVVSGTCALTDGETHWELGPGDCYHAAAGVPHGATGGEEGCVIIDAFSPPRQQIVEMLAGM